MQKPDQGEKAIRFGCGFIFGLSVGFCGAARFLFYSSDWLEAGLIGLVAGFVCGWLAMTHGDDFWHSLRDWWWF